jgi:hypothetical protein
MGKGRSVQMNPANIVESRLRRNSRCSRASEQLERLTALQVFRARCEARALLYVAGELDLHEAVDALQAAAIASALIREIGQDAVQAIMAEAFEGAR